MSYSHCVVGKIDSCKLCNFLKSRSHSGGPGIPTDCCLLASMLKAKSWKANGLFRVASPVSGPSRTKPTVPLTVLVIDVAPGKSMRFILDFTETVFSEVPVAALTLQMVSDRKFSVGGFDRGCLQPSEHRSQVP